MSKEKGNSILAANEAESNVTPPAKEEIVDNVDESKVKKNVKKPSNDTVVPGKTSDEPKSSLEQIIESLASLNFLVSPATEVRAPTVEDVKSMLRGGDEITLVEKEKYDMMYSVWTDIPNRNHYIIRNPVNFVKFNDFDGLIQSFLDLFVKRMDKSRLFIREPDRIFLRNNRVYDPNTLGYPTEHILSDSAANDLFRSRLEDVCTPIEVESGVIKIRVLGDVGVIRANMNLMSYSMSNMAQSRMKRESLMNEIARIQRKEKMCLNPRNAFEFYQPSFDYVIIQGPFDRFRKSAKLRLLFMQAVLTPHVMYVPLSTTELMKHAAINATRTGFAIDISARTFKPEHHNLYSAYIMSLLCPGEIIFDFDFTTGSEISTPLKGFAALIARLSFMFDECSIFTNTSVDAQIAIDNAIINWGLEMNAIVSTGAASSSKYPLNGYRLVRASADEQMQFNYLKIRDGSGGACGNGNLYRKANERMRDFYPEIAVRANYVVDCDDYIGYRNGLVNKYTWCALLGADIFINRMPNASGYRGLLQVISTRIYEFFIRINEYTHVNWYTSFRMNDRTSRMYNIDTIQKRSVRMTLTTDFLLSVPKGFDNNEWRPIMGTIDKLRFESSFTREANKVAYLYKYAMAIFEFTGSMRSYPSRRLITLACAYSSVFKFIRDYLYYADEDKKLVSFFDCFFSDNGLLGIFRPLLTIDTSFLHMYGVIRSVIVHCILNPWNESTIREKLNSKGVLTNISRRSIATTYSYRDIEKLILNRSFRAVFAKSDSEPFKLHLLLPYEIVNKIDHLRNDRCIDKRESKERELSVSFESSVINKSIGLLISSIDPRDYNFLDDYYTAPSMIDSYWLDGAEYADIVVPVSDFYDTIGERVANTIALTRKDYKFISLYD